MKKIGNASIKQVLALFLGAMACVVFAYGGIDLSGSIKRRSAAEAILSSARSSQLLLGTLLGIRLERGALGTALNGEAPVDPAQTVKIDGYRKTAEDDYQKLVAEILASGVAGPIAILPSLTRTHDVMVGKHQQFDDDARLVRTARTPRAFETEQATYQDFLNALTAATDAVDAAIRNADKIADEYLAIKRAAWATRVQYGATQVRAQTPIAAGRSWTSAETYAAYEGRGRTLALWNAVKDAAAAQDVSAVVREAFDKADQENFTGAARDDANRLFDALASGAPVGITIKELQPRDTARAGLVVGVADAAQDQMVARAEIVLAHATNAVITSLAALLAALLLVVFGLAVVQRRISRPLQRMNDIMRRLAAGDASVIITDLDRGDEIGEMGRAVQFFKEKLVQNGALEENARRLKSEAEQKRHETLATLADKLENAVGSTVFTVSSSATQMEATARQMADSAVSTLERATFVSSASERASANVTAIAGASEELGASVREIARQVEHSVDRAKAAVAEAGLAAGIISDLNETASKINTIVDLISDIAAQTNLLALNATIEAARAGEAGRGFAVVAAEVKGLANQTSKATVEIGQQIAAVQMTTTRAARAIEGVTERIKEIDQAANQISTTVEQQSEATMEIVKSMSVASASATEVSSVITDVAQAASDTGSGAKQVLTISSELSAQSRRLRAEVDGFLAAVRTA